MNKIQDISEANCIDIYVFEEENPITLNAEIVPVNKGDDLLEYSELFKSNVNKNFEQKFVKFTHYNPGFIYIKIIKKPLVDKIVFRNGLKVLDTLYFYSTDNLGVRINDKIFNYWTILTFEFKFAGQELDKTFEYYIHKENEDAHLKDIKNINFELMSKSLISKLNARSFIDSVNSQRVNSNFLTKDYQLFYLGNLIKDGETFLLEDAQSRAFDTTDENVDVDFEYLNKINISNIYLGD